MWKLSTTVQVGAFVILSGIALFAARPAATKQAAAPQPTPEQKKLAAFIGTWHDEADMKASAFGPATKMTNVQTCDWYAGGPGVICNTDSNVGGMAIKTVTLLNYNADEKLYWFYEMNSFGQSDQAKGTVDGDVWTFLGEWKLNGKTVKTKTTIRIPTPTTSTMTTDASVDGGAWSTVMELKGTKDK